MVMCKAPFTVQEWLPLRNPEPRRSLQWFEECAHTVWTTIVLLCRCKNCLEYACDCQ